MLLSDAYRIYITYYNTPDNLRIALEDNLIEISAKNSENHKLRMITNTFVQIALQCNAAFHVMSCMYSRGIGPWFYLSNMADNIA